jgi:uncharacterized protein (UPF0276 family)
MLSKYNTDDLRISETKEVVPPVQVHDEIPMTDEAARTTLEARQAIHNILSGDDDRLLVVIGPCSIHDTKAALEYAHRLKTLKDLLRQDLEIVMRVYFEKPRTTVGWKGLINDPELNSSFNINKGLRLARQLLLDVNNIYVYSVNHGYDPVAFLQALPANRISYIHVAGHYNEADDLIVDTHGADVIDPVWELLDKTYTEFGVIPTLLERDFNIPPLPELLTEVDKITSIQTKHGQHHDNIARQG